MLTEVQRGPARIRPRRDTASNNLSLHNMFIVDEEGETFGLRKYSLTHLQTKSVRWYLRACCTTARLLADTPVCVTTIPFQVQPAQFSVPNSHSQDVLDMEYARRRAFNT